MVVRRLSNKNTGIITTLLILSVLSFLFWLSRSTFFIKKPNVLSFAVTMDLVVTIPLIYFISIRKKKIPNISVVPILLGMMLLGSFIIPAGYHKYLDLIKMIVFPAAELFAMGYLILTTRKVISEYKKEGYENPDFFTVLKASVLKVIHYKRISEIISTEIAVLYYAFFTWKKSNIQFDKQNVFTYTKKSGSAAIVAALCIIVFVEAFALHFLVAQWNVLAAWILTISSFYALIYLVGNYRASLQRPIFIEENGLNLKSGIISEVFIPFELIEDILISSKDLLKNQKHTKMNFMSGHNIILRLKDDCMSTHLYGIKKRGRVFTLFVDEKEKFESCIKEKIKMYSN